MTEIRARDTRHRSRTGRHFENVPIHAAPGLHEQAIVLVKRFLPPQAKIADVGAGSGAFSLRLRAHGYDPLPIDLDTTDIPKELGALQADVCTDLMSLLEPATLDGVVALEVIEHLDCPARFFEEVARLLKPGGGLLISTPNILHPYSRVKFFFTGKYWLFDERAYYSTGHTTPLPAWLLREHALNAGFENVRIGYGGSLEMVGLRRLIAGFLSKLYRPRATLDKVDDGVNLFLFASKPAS